MKFQIASDIHLEILETKPEFDKHYQRTFKLLIEPVAPILILAGDITSPNAKATIPFLNWCSNHFEHTFWIMGNHEYYTPITMIKEDILEHYRSFCKSNVHILNNQTYCIDNVLFVGTTLWSNIPKEYETDIQLSINDYRMIYSKEGKRISPRDIRAEFTTNINFLNTTIAENLDKEIVIISHHAPLNKGTSLETYEGSITNTAYASHIDLSNDSNVRYWIYGHTHHNNEIQKGNYTVVSNQLGYFGEHTGIGYDFAKVFTV